MMDLKDRALDHIAFTTPDLDKTVAWYKSVGFTVYGAFSVGDTRCCFMTNGAYRYEFIQPPDLPADAPETLDHVALFSTDIEKDYAMCKEAGLTMLTDGVQQLDHFFENGIRYFSCSQAPGQVLEFGQLL